MAKGVFTSKVVPSYDDLPEEHYHFPKTYLNQVKETVGDWILYYEPRRLGKGFSGTGGRQSYIAIAQVNSVEQDPTRSDHYYAFVSNFIEFDTPVPFKMNDNYFEQSLVKEDGSTNKGSFGRSVRILPDNEYNQIVRMGFGNNYELKGEYDLLKVSDKVDAFERQFCKITTNKPFRDVAFASNIKKAYSNCCSFTGIKLANSTNLYEVEAAHIRPVGGSHNGPDSIRNGLALSRTFHWMFDNGLITISDQYDIITDDKLVPRQVLDLINKSGKLILPSDNRFFPHKKFLEYHRDVVFKG